MDIPLQAYMTGAEAAGGGAQRFQQRGRPVAAVPKLTLSVSYDVNRTESSPEWVLSREAIRVPEGDRGAVD